MTKPDTTSTVPDRLPVGNIEGARREKCKAIRKSGKRCSNWPIRGGVVCRMHGGGAPQVKAAAARRLQREQLEVDTGQLLEEMELDAAGRGPTELLLDAVYRAHAMVQMLGALVGGIPAEGFTRRHHLGGQAPNVLTEMYGTWVERAARAAKLALDAGVAERLVRVEQDKAQTIAGVLRSTLDDPRLGLSPEQRATAGQIMAEQFRALASG